MSKKVHTMKTMQTVDDETYAAIVADRKSFNFTGTEGLRSASEAFVAAGQENTTSEIILAAIEDAMNYDDSEVVFNPYSSSEFSAQSPLAAYEPFDNAIEQQDGNEPVQPKL